MSKHKIKENLDNWESYEDSEVYKDFKEKSDPEAPTLNHSAGLDVQLHNNIDTSYQKTLNTVKFFLKSALGKFSKRNNWKVEVWVDKENQKRSDEDELISCGVALKRPNASTIYARKAAGSLNRAASNALSVLEEAIKTERSRWKRISAKNRTRRELIWQ